jgi:hypothetical protein
MGYNGMAAIRNSGGLRQRGSSVSLDLALGRGRLHHPLYNQSLAQVSRRVRLAETDPTTEPALTFYNFYHNLILPIMNIACQSEANAAKCASYNIQLSQIENSLNQGLANGDIVALISAGLSMKSLYDDVKNTLNPDAPPPVNPPPPPPPPPSTGVPMWVWILGSVVVVGTGVGVIYAVTRKK